MHIINGIDIGNFIKARDKFEQFRKHLNSEQEEAGAVHAFKYSYELAGKTIKRILSAKGLEATSPRDCFRLAASVGLISAPFIWFEFIKIRNFTSYTYDIDNLNKVIAVFESFSNALDELVTNLNNSQ